MYRPPFELAGLLKDTPADLKELTSAVTVSYNKLKTDFAAKEKTEVV